MSTAQLQQTIIKKVSILQDEELLQTILKILQQKIRKATSPAKQKNVLPAHIREGIAQSLKEHKQGLGVILETDEEVQNHFSNLKKQNV